MSNKRMNDQSGEAVTGIAHDSPAREQAEALLADQNRVLEAIAVGRPLREVLDAIVVMIERQSPGTLCSILLADDEGRRLCFGAAPTLPREYSEAIEGLSIGPMSGCCGAAAWSRTLEVASDIATDPRWEAFRAIALAYGLRACWSSPIFSADGRITGTFALYARECRCPGEQHLRLLDSAAHMAGIAIDRTRAERALRTSEGRLRLAVEAAQLGTWDYNPLTGETDWSDRSRAIWGIGADQPVGGEFYFSSIHPDDRDRVRGTFEAALDPAGAGQWQVAYRIVRPDGGIRWVSTSARACFAEIHGARRATRLIGTVRDVTEQVQAEQALQESRRFIGRVLDTSANLIYVYDTLEQRNIYANKQLASLVGYTPEEVQAMGSAMLPTLLHPDDHWMIEAMPRRLGSLRDGEVLESEYRVRHANGEWRWFRDRATIFSRTPEGRPGALLGTAQDITERRQAEEALRQSEARFRAMAETVPAVLFTSLPDGTIDYANQWTVDYAGVPRESAEGWQWTALLHPEDAWVQERWKHALATGEPFEGEYRLRAADGSYRWFIGRARPIRDAQAQIVKWFGVVTDITDRKRAEAALSQAKEAAEAANRSKDQFLAVLSHELRTPLTPVLTATQLMERDPHLPSDLRESAAMVRRNVELEARLIDDLLDLTGISRAKLQLHLTNVDLHTKLRNVIEICDSDIRAKHQKLTVELNATRHHVQADAARLQQILWNLLRNSVKFTPSAGRITIRTEDRDGRVAVSIADTGIGIEPEVLPRLFSAFEQGGKGITRQFGGLGLGLAISRGLVDLHGGQLAAHSEGRGKGATFTVVLPVTVAKVAETVEGPLPGAHPVRRACRILLVEDHPDTAKTMGMLLKSYGFAVRIATSKAAALKAAEAEEFDLLISDIGLPDGSGLELMRQLQARRPLVGVALSGYGMEEDIRRSREAGFVEHLTKPIDLNRLERVLHRICG